MRKAKNLKPNLIVERTEAQLHESGFTYNESGKTYNDVFAYGGVYGYQDIKPLVSKADDRTASIVSSNDILGTAGTVLYRGMPLAPGFFLYITYPTSEAIFN